MVSSSPGLIAASHVLLRLSKPRHSPYALLTCRKRCSRSLWSSQGSWWSPLPADHQLSRRRIPPAYEFECDSRFPRRSCVGRIAPSELHGVPNASTRSISLVTTVDPRCRHARRHARCGSPPRRRSLRQKLNSQWFTWCLRDPCQTFADSVTHVQAPERR
jgi:hypothetical protein